MLHQTDCEKSGGYWFESDIENNSFCGEFNIKNVKNKYDCIRLNGFWNNEECVEKLFLMLPLKKIVRI